MDGGNNYSSWDGSFMSLFNSQTYIASLGEASSNPSGYQLPYGVDPQYYMNTQHNIYPNVETNRTNQFPSVEASSSHMSMASSSQQVQVEDDLVVDSNGVDYKDEWDRFEEDEEEEGDEETQETFADE